MTTPTTYTPCETFDSYVDIWLKCAGDQNLLDEIMEHRAACPTCLGNVHDAMPAPEKTSLELWFESEMETPN